MLNVVAIMGRLTKDIERNFTQNNISYCNFTIACERSYSKQGEERQVDFIDCMAWRNTADFLENWFSKGDLIAINGSLQTNMYTDKNGNKRKSVQILVSEANFAGASKNKAGSRQSKPPQQSQGGYNPPKEQSSEISQGEQQAFKQTPSGGSSTDFRQISDDEDLPF